MSHPSFFLSFTLVIENYYLTSLEHLVLMLDGLLHVHLAILVSSHAAFAYAILVTHKPMSHIDKVLAFVFPIQPFDKLARLCV